MKLTPQHAPARGRAARRLTRCALALAALYGTSAFAQVSISETFRNDTAPGWTLQGSAELTSSHADPTGDGWLRLTSPANDQAGTALFDTQFSTATGIEVAFDYATYGGTGADGFTFYLIDGTTAAPTVGAPGGSLGYSWRGSNNAPGVTNGYVGIGFDEYGNFSNNGFGLCTAPTPACGFMPNHVAIRGSGSGLNGFPLLATVPQAIQADRAGAKHVRITITPAPNVLITVQVNGTTVIDKAPLVVGGAPVAGMQALPSSFKMGFSSSTGGSTNYHEIRNVGVLLAPLQAIDDTYATPAGQVLTEPPGALGANDLNVPPGAVYTLVTAPPNTQGTVDIDANGGFSFTPAPGFTGDARFSYQVCASTGSPCSVATAVVSVTAGPAPVAKDDPFNAMPGQPVTGNVGTNDINLPAGAVFSLVTAPPPDQGTLVFNPDGSFTFTPAAGFSGTQFVYRVCAPTGSPCVQATATIRAGGGAAAGGRVTAVPTLEWWSLAGLGTLLAGLGARRRRH